MNTYDEKKNPIKRQQVDKQKYKKSTAQATQLASWEEPCHQKSHDQCLPLSKDVENFDKQVIVLATSNSLIILMTLEALFIKQFKPVLNTKDKYKSRTLTLKYC